MGKKGEGGGAFIRHLFIGLSPEHNSPFFPLPSLVFIYAKRAPLRLPYSASASLAPSPIPLSPLSLPPRSDTPGHYYTVQHRTTLSLFLDLLALHIPIKKSGASFAAAAGKTAPLLPTLTPH